MSDGPHRSLPMRRGWKRVAEWADNLAFERKEIKDAIISALEEDCSREMSPEFASNLRCVCTDQEGLLFKIDVGAQLEGLRGVAGSGIGRVVLEHAIRLSAAGTAMAAISLIAMTDALDDRVARCARQVEEHYHRESTGPRANRVRTRIEQAIDRAANEGLARQILTPKPDRVGHTLRKREGVDDGVRL